MDKVEKIYQARRMALKGIEVTLSKPVDISGLAELVLAFNMATVHDSQAAALRLALALAEIVDEEVLKDARLLAPRAQTQRSLNIACLNNPGAPVQLTSSRDYGLAENKSARLNPEFDNDLEGRN